MGFFRRRRIKSPPRSPIPEQKPRTVPLLVAEEIRPPPMASLDILQDRTVTTNSRGGQETVDDRLLRYLLWFSTLVGGVLVILAFASSWLLITFPVAQRYDGPFLNLGNPKVVAIINAAWGLLFTIMLLFVQQIFLTALVRRVTASRIPDQMLDHFQFLLRLRITLGALTMVVLLLGVMSIFIESAVLRGAVVLAGAWTVFCWYWMTNESRGKEFDARHQENEADVVVV